MAGTSKREGGRGHWRPRRAAGRQRQTGTAMAADAGAGVSIIGIGIDVQEKGLSARGGQIVCFRGGNAAKSQLLRKIWTID